MLFSLIGVLLCLVVICNCDQCIRYEFHETVLNPEGNSELLINDCRNSNSKITDYNAAILQIYGPPMINITFNCCSSLPCRNDLQCPFNFNCNRGKCLVADCNLRDELEIVEVENEECIIDEDCYFKIPLDKKHWSCLSETSECINKENCSKKCKRCAFVGDHWSNFGNNTIDVGLYNNESPNTSLINDLLPVRNTSTESTVNSLVEFNLNSLINEPESETNDSNELRSEEGFSRLLDNSRNTNLITVNHSTSSTTESPPTNRSSNRLSFNNDLVNPFVNSTTIPNRFLNSNNITSILEFINNSSNNLNNNNNVTTTTRPNHSRSTSRPDTTSSSSGFTRNDLPTNILNELTRSNNLEPSSSTTTTSTTTNRPIITETTPSTTPSTTVSSSEESSSSNEANSNEFRLNSTIDDFLFTRTRTNNIENNNENNDENSSNSINTNRSIDNNFLNLFSSLFSNNSSLTTTNTSINTFSIPLINSSSSSIIRTNNVFNSPFNTLFNNIPSISTSITTSTIAPTLSTINSESSTINSESSTINTSTINTSTSSPSTSAVLSAASILNRSRSATRNTDNRFSARRSSTSLRTTNSGRSLLNNHRLIHLPNNNRINNRHINTSNNTSNRNRRTSTTTSTTTTTMKPPSINNPYYHLTSVLNNNNAFNNEMLPHILYAMDSDFDIPRLNPITTRLNTTTVH